MIPITDLAPKINESFEELNSVVSEVLLSNRFILAGEVDKFEGNFASYLGANYCVGVGSGTDALELSLKCMDMDPGAIVATAANAGGYAVNAILASNLKPYFMDVDLDTGVVPLAAIQKAINAGASAVILTHLFGLLAPNILQIAALCKEKSVFMIEDCAQAHGARLNNQFAGTFGDIGTFSFYPTKNLGALGDAGGVVTNDLHFYKKMTALRQYGWIDKYKVEYLNGVNSRLDEIQAAMLRILLLRLDEHNDRRRFIAKRYVEEVKNPFITLPKHSLGPDFVAHLFVIKTKYRTDLKKYLLKNGVGSEIHYPILDYQQPAYVGLFDNVSLLNSELLVNQVLSIPCFPGMTNDQVTEVVGLLNAWAPPFSRKR